MSYSPRSICAGFLEARLSIRSKTVVAALLFAIASSICLWAQNTEATVLGTVRDPSGSVVAGAAVQLSNQGTGATRSATSDSNGDYRFSGVEIGSYVLKIDATGFQKEEFSIFVFITRYTRHVA